MNDDDDDDFFAEFSVDMDLDTASPPAAAKAQPAERPGNSAAGPGSARPPARPANSGLQSLSVEDDVGKSGLEEGGNNDATGACAKAG